MEDALIAATGPLPRTHGMLGAMLEGEPSYRSADIRQHPRFRGWWPKQHPDMHSFLGVPIVAADGVIGAFYLTDKEGASEFSDADEQLIELLAAHAAIAITNARLYERSRELSTLAERNRLALELHDVVSQKLFSLVLSAEAASTRFDRDPERARGQLARLGGLAREALEELRVLTLELRPADPHSDGLAGALRKHVQVPRTVHETDIDFQDDARGEGTGESARDQEVLRVAQEALHDALEEEGSLARRVTSWPVTVAGASRW
ncbi:MAG TPA: histidine kinase [Solirubrobacteraceae bacterium]|jgi:signal transduction histidine kinase|nr:histidine kinase [Solirubrobacteraceae bacterium]